MWKTQDFLWTIFPVENPVIYPKSIHRFIHSRNPEVFSNNRLIHKSTGPTITTKVIYNGISI